MTIDSQDVIANDEIWQALLMKIGLGTHEHEIILQKRQNCFIIADLGDVAEWLKAHAWKVCIR